MTLAFPVNICQRCRSTGIVYLLYFVIFFVSDPWLTEAFWQPTGLGVASPKRYVFSSQSLFQAPNNEEQKDSDGGSNNSNEFDLRNNFGRQLRGLESAGMKELAEEGDTVVCLKSLENLAIYENASYELRSIFAQRFDEEMQQMEKRPLANMDDSLVPSGFERYVVLYSPLYHKEPVVVLPEEVGLVTVRSQIIQSSWLAIPGFFWVFVCLSFYNTYHEKTGGGFWDAFWGR